MTAEFSARLRQTQETVSTCDKKALCSPIAFHRWVRMEGLVFSAIWLCLVELLCQCEKFFSFLLRWQILSSLKCHWPISWCAGLRSSYKLKTCYMSAKRHQKMSKSKDPWIYFIICFAALWFLHLVSQHSPMRIWGKCYSGTPIMQSGLPGVWTQACRDNACTKTTQ